MKKFVSGIIVGVMLFAGASVFADSVGLVGKKVTGIFTVEKDGSKLAEAAIINGTAYAPVRSVAEATGTKLKVEGKRIIIESTEKNLTNSVDSAEVIEPVEPVTTVDPWEQKKQSDIEGLTKGIEEGRSTIAKLESILASERARLSKAETEGEKSNISQSISDLEIRIKQEKDSIVESEERIAELKK